MSDVAAGFLAFTEVTADGDHRAYNEWHQLDHLPEQFLLPGVVFGQRWVASPDCRAASLPVADPLPAFHYLTLYLLTHPLSATLQQFFALATRLTDLGRFYPHRRTALSGAWLFLEALAAPRVQVSPLAVPHRPSRGVYAVVEELAGSPADDDYVREAHARLLPELLALPGVAGACRFGRRVGVGRPGEGDLRTRVTVLFLDGDPVEVAGEVGPRVRAHWDGRVRPRHAGPLRTVRPWEWDWFDR